MNNARELVPTLTAVFLLGWSVPVTGQAATNSFVNWETAPVHPVAMSPSGSILAVCNLPDSRIEFFDLMSGSPRVAGSVTVGLDPVSVRWLNDDEVWVVNSISDSVSVVSAGAFRVMVTLDTLDEPADVAFAGSPTRAFVSCSSANAVLVFDPTTRRLLKTIALLAGGNERFSSHERADGHPDAAGYHRS